MLPVGSLTNFDSTKEGLVDVLTSIRDGKTRLPDFQRGWVWDDEHIRSLLASVSRSYPIGAVMMLQTGNPDVRLQPRLVEGVPSSSLHDLERLILDGQQRLTSLFLALLSNSPVPTFDPRGNRIRRWYYLDIDKALNSNLDREEAILSIPENRVIRNFRGEIIADYSDRTKECLAEALPIQLVFDVAGLTTWQMEYIRTGNEDVEARLKRWNALLQDVVQRFQQYQVPLILLRKETPKHAVCQVFEKVNTGGVALTVFELLTATFAVDNFSLRDDWKVREDKIRDFAPLESIESTDFLQGIALLATYSRRKDWLDRGLDASKSPGISCKRKDILDLGVHDYKAQADNLSEGFRKAARFLFSQKIFSARDLPYRPQLVPLAAAFALLGRQGEDHGVRAKLAQWYWCGVLGELYGGTTESRLARDLPDLLTWVDGGGEPSTVGEAIFTPARLFSMRTRNSAAYKGLYALLIRDGCLDFRTGEALDTQRYFDERIDIHHIFPQAWCKTNGISATECDCIINKTPISARTNRTIGGNAPSTYLPRLRRSAGINDEKMREILESHVIDPVSLEEDDFNTFFKQREQTLLSRIESAMGKPITRDAVEPPVEGTEAYQKE